MTVPTAAELHERLDELEEELHRAERDLFTLSLAYRGGDDKPRERPYADAQANQSKHGGK